MKESVLSLRLLFVVVGIFLVISGAFIAIFSLVVPSQYLVVTLLIVQLLFSIAFGFRYVYFGLYLSKYFNQYKVRTLKKFLLVSYGMELIFVFIEFIENDRIDFLTIVLGALIMWYLYRSVGRLSTEFILDNQEV